MNRLARFRLASFALAAFLPGMTPLAGQTSAPTAKPRDEEFITEKGFKSTILEIKHRDPAEIVNVLRPLASGFRGAAISANREHRTISVRDFPENIASIEAAVKRLDVPEPPRSDVELRLYVLVASAGEAAGGRYPEDLAPAVAALKGTLQYKTYALAASFLERVRDGARGIVGAGTAQIGEGVSEKDNPLVQLEYHITQLLLDSSGPTPVIKLDGFALEVSGRGRAQLKTDVSLREGEKVVVGTSTMTGKGLVVVLTGRAVR